MSEWSDMCTCILLFQSAEHNKNSTKHVGLVQNGHHDIIIVIISINVTCFLHDIA